MSEKDYYEILGVSPNAADEEIKTAFRRLALRYHPDKNPDDSSTEERFRLINEAYTILGDPEKRAEYDKKRGERQRQDRERYRRQTEYVYYLLDKVSIHVPRLKSLGLGKLLLSLLRSLKLRSPKGPWGIGDVTVKLTISMEEAFRGTEKILEIYREKRCSLCGGSGKTKESRLEPCTKCAGTGNIFVKQDNFMVNTPCPICDGTGFILVHPCPNCRGFGTIEEPQRLLVKIPPGVRNNTKIRIKGQGRLDPRGRRGDLYILVRVKRDEFLQRRGDDVYCELDVSFVDAVLGATLEVKTLDGRAMLKIPPGTKSGTILRMRGRGFLKSDGSRGDQLVRINVVIPKNLSPEQRKLLERFRRSGGTR